MPVTVFQDKGNVHVQYPFGQERPCDDIHWFDPWVQYWLYETELSAVVDAATKKLS